MSNTSTWHIDRMLPGATTPGQRGPGNNGNEWALYIPQSARVRASPSAYLMSYPGNSLYWWGGLSPLQRSSRRIIQPQLTGSPGYSLWWGVLPVCREAVVVFYSTPLPTGLIYFGVVFCCSFLFVFSILIIFVFRFFVFNVISTFVGYLMPKQSL